MCERAEDGGLDSMIREKRDAETAGWLSLWNKLWKDKPELDAPEVSRLLGLIGAIALLAALLGPIYGGTVAVALWFVALICWAAHQRARRVEAMWEWAIRHD